jgi:hypothetical protein
MIFLNKIEEFIKEKPSYIFVGSTARKSEKFAVLPKRYINGKLAVSILVTEEELCKEIMKIVDGVIPVVFADIENKQNLNIYQIAIENIEASELLPYKPNDMTVEAADVLVNHLFHNDLYGKKVLIYGTGNIATKVALRLAERNCQVFLSGRNIEKANNIVLTLNLILPKYASFKINLFNPKDINIKLNALISFVSAEQVITKSFANYMDEHAFLVDGGINNFSEDIISVLEKSLQFIRLDTRIGLPFVEAYSRSIKSEFFNEVIGRRNINGIECVAGGIIGNKGDVILDKITSPTQIIGIANGIGGLINEREYSSKDSQQLSAIKKSRLFNF